MNAAALPLSLGTPATKHFGWGWWSVGRRSKVRSSSRPPRLSPGHRLGDNLYWPQPTDPALSGGPTLASRPRSVGPSSLAPPCKAKLNYIIANGGSDFIAPSQLVTRKKSLSLYERAVMGSSMRRFCLCASADWRTYLLPRIFLTVTQHGGSHGHLGRVAAVITALGGYLLWADFIKAAPNG